MNVLKLTVDTFVYAVQGFEFKKYKRPIKIIEYIIDELRADSVIVISKKGVRKQLMLSDFYSHKVTYDEFKTYFFATLEEAETYSKFLWENEKKLNSNSIESLKALLVGLEDNAEDFFKEKLHNYSNLKELSKEFFELSQTEEFSELGVPYLNVGLYLSKGNLSVQSKPCMLLELNMLEEDYDEEDEGLEPIYDKKYEAFEFEFGNDELEERYEIYLKENMFYEYFNDYNYLILEKNIAINENGFSEDIRSIFQEKISLLKGYLKTMNRGFSVLEGDFSLNILEYKFFE